VLKASCFRWTIRIPSELNAVWWDYQGSLTKDAPKCDFRDITAPSDCRNYSSEPLTILR
jgi:hypothetical protein